MPPPPSPPSRFWFKREAVAGIIYSDAFRHAVIGLVLVDLVLVFADMALALNTVCTPHPAYPSSSSSPSPSSPVPSHLAHGSSAAGAANTTAPESNVAAAAGGSHLSTCTPNLALTEELWYAQEAIFWASSCLLAAFACDVLLHLHVEGWKLFRSVVASVDAIIIFGSLCMAFAFRYTDTEVTGTGAIVALRIWKIVRIMHAVAVTINRGHRKLLTAILDSNSAIASACHKPLRAFEDGKDTFFRGLRKLERDASGWGVERRRSARCDKREEGPGSSGFGKGSSSRLDAVQPAKQIQRQEELRTMAMMMDEAGLFMDTLQMALREMEVQVAAANKRRLDTAIQNAHLTGEEARDGEGLVLEEEELFRHHLHLLAEADGHHHSSPGKEKNDEVREGKFLTA